MIDAGDYESVYTLLHDFDSIITTPMKNTLKLQCLPLADVGSSVIFGTYEQDNNTENGKEDIEWQVLAKENGRILVISKYGLDAKIYGLDAEKFDDERMTDGVEPWMNQTFLNTAFNAKERSMIPSVTVSADANPKYDTDPGKDTTAQVFLLSITEATEYFSSDDARKCVLTDYATERSAHISLATGLTEKIDGVWWLRTPGDADENAAYVQADGSINFSGNYKIIHIKAVRPALWIDLEA